MSHTLQVLSGLIASLMICSLSFKDLMPKPVTEDKVGCIAKLVHVDNWKNMKYVIWAVSVPSALFGYFVPYVHIVRI